MSNDQAPQRFRYIPLLALAVVVTLAGFGVYWMVQNFLHSAPPPTKKVVQEIHVIRPPPPPPETPPPPPPPEEKVDVHEPEQQPDPTPSNDPPPSQQLGLDAEGGAGGDGFGLVGNKGGRDLLASGGGNAFTWYAGLIKTEILDRLQDDKDVRKGSYSAKVDIWLRQDGTIERIRLAQSSGDKVRDKAIEADLAQITRISQAPPVGMPQPIKLRIDSRA